MSTIPAHPAAVKPIKSVSSDQHEILRNIIALHIPGGVDLDCTYSKGQFYAPGSGVVQPRLKYDLNPCVPGVLPVDCRALPLASSSIPSIICDLPFIHAHGNASVIGGRFSSYPSQKALHEMYRAALAEFARVLVPDGVLVFKCQDCVESGKQVMSHCLVWEVAVRLGFEVLDLFIQTAEHRMTGWNHGRQVHARKHHAYWWVFRKKRKTEW